MLSEFRSHNAVQAVSRLNSFREGRTTPCRCCDLVSRETEDSMHASVVNRWEVDMRQRNCSPAVGGDRTSPNVQRFVDHWRICELFRAPGYGGLACVGEIGGLSAALRLPKQSFCSQHDQRAEWQGKAADGVPYPSAMCLMLDYSTLVSRETNLRGVMSDDLGVG